MYTTTAINMLDPPQAIKLLHTWLYKVFTVANTSVNYTSNMTLIKANLRKRQIHSSTLSSCSRLIPSNV